MNAIGCLIPDAASSMPPRNAPEGVDDVLLILFGNTYSPAAMPLEFGKQAGYDARNADNMAVSGN